MDMALQDKITRCWEERAAVYDNQYGHGLKSEEEKTAWQVTLKESVGAGPLRILDVGTGTGFLALILAELGHRCSGVDLSQEMLQQAQKKARQAGFKIDFRVGDAENLPFKDSSFDVVINRHLLWTLPRPEAALREWVRALKPGGRLIIIDGRWAAPDISTKVKRLVGNCLIALAERRNPWKWMGHYGKEIQKQLPFMGGAGPDKIAPLLEAAGLTDVSIQPLARVMEAQKRAMPLRYRLVYAHRRYLAAGRKPE